MADAVQDQQAVDATQAVVDASPNISAQVIATTVERLRAAEKIPSHMIDELATALRAPASDQPAVIERLLRDG